MNVSLNYPIVLSMIVQVVQNVIQVMKYSIINVGVNYQIVMSMIA